MGTSYTDKGVIFGATNDGTGSFKNADGTAGTMRTLTNANYIAGAWIASGLSQRLRLVVTGVLSGGGAASAAVVLEGRRIDAQNETIFQRPFVIDTARPAAPSNPPATSQTIATADLVGESVADGLGGGASTEALDVALLTTDHFLADEYRVLVKTGAAPAAGDQLFISAQEV